MRRAFLYGLIILRSSNCIGQELIVHNDTVNKFAIGIPGGWKYGVPPDNSATFIALRQKANETDRPRESISINFVYRIEPDLYKSYKSFMETMRKEDGFMIMDEGERIVNDRKYKWLIETHRNKSTKEEMEHYVMFTNNHGEIFILTMTSTAENFSRYIPLFERIGMTLKY